VGIFPAPIFFEMNNRLSHIFFGLCLLLLVIIIPLLVYPCHAADDKGTVPTIEEKPDSTNQEIIKKEGTEQKEGDKPAPDKSSDQPNDIEENPWDNGRDMGC
jgi:hypothetical protein